MKKKILVTTLLVSTMFAMTACGGNTTTQTPNDSQSKVESSVDSSTVETPEDSSSVETPETETPYVDMLGDEDFVYEVKDGKIIMVLNNHSWEWTVSNYENNFTCVNGTEGDGVVSYYVLTPTTPGYVEVNAYGLGGEMQIDNYLMCTINDDLTMAIDENFNKDELLGEIPGMEEVAVDAETDAVMQVVLNGLGDTIYRDSLVTRMVNLEDYDAEWILGGRVGDLTGMQCAEVTEPMMGSIALSIAVVEFDTAENAEAGATILKESAPTDKWVCVIPDDVRTVVVDNCVVVIMANMDVITAFDAIEF